MVRLLPLRECHLQITRRLSLEFINICDIFRTFFGGDHISDFMNKGKTSRLRASIAIQYMGEMFETLARPTLLEV
jgi:hypothetical protein